MDASVNATPSSSLDFPLPNQLSYSYLYAEERVWAVRVLSPINPLLILFGLVANTINMIVFYKVGVKDNVTTLLFSLAMSDTAYLCLISPQVAFWIIWVFTSVPQSLYGTFFNYEQTAGNYPWPFHFLFVFGLFYWPAFTAFDLSCFISLSLGVMRCACVAMPLKFKLVFTRFRTVKWVLFLVVMAVLLRIPMLSVFRVILKSDPVTNTTYPYVVSVNNAFMSRINDIMNRGIVIWTNYLVMVCCVCLLSFKLYKASIIRRSCTNQDSAQSQQGMSAKDVQVVKSVVLVCSIFIFSQLPLLLVSLNRLLNAYFSIGKGLYGLFSLISNVSITCSILNASVNIFVYYNYNSKYRTTFHTLFRFLMRGKTDEK